MPGAIKDLTTNEFDSRVLEADHTVVVVFWAPWCGPCRTILEEIAGLSKETSTEFLKLNVDKESEPTIRYDVLAIPQVFVFSHGRAVQSITGFRSKKQLRKELSLWLPPLDSTGGEA